MATPQVAFQTQPQAQTVQVEIIEVLKKWNIDVKGIEQWVRNILSGKVPSVGGGEVDLGKPILYAHDTWGSCRELKVVVTENGKFIDGTWIDSSSRRNAHKYKVGELDTLIGKVVEIYVRYSPSCNKSRQMSFRAKVKVG